MTQGPSAALSLTEKTLIAVRSGTRWRGPQGLAHRTRTLALLPIPHRRLSEVLAGGFFCLRRGGERRYNHRHDA